MHLRRLPEAPGLGAGHPHHRRAAQRAGKLARLPLLERRARRHLTSVNVTACPPASPPFIRRARSKAAASPSKAPGFRSTARRCPRCASAARRARVVYASPTELSRRSCPPGLDGGRAPIASTACRTTTRVRRRRGAVRDRPAPGRQPGLRSRRQPLRHLQRHARAAGAGLDLPRAARTARARPFSSGIVNPTSMAIDPRRPPVRVEPVRRHGLPRDAGRHGRAVRHAISASPAAWRSRADGTLFVGDRSGTIFRVDRDGRATTFASLPPSVAAFHLAFGPDGALYVTGPTLSSYDAALPHRAGRHGDDAVRAVRPAAGARVRSPAARCSSSRRWPARAACIACRRPARRSWCCRGPGLVGVAFDAGAARRSSCRARTTPPIGCRLARTSHVAPERRAPRTSGSRPDTIPPHVPTLSAQADCGAGRGHAGRAEPEAVARRRRSDHAGDRRGDRRRHLRRDRHRGGRADRARTAR